MPPWFRSRSIFFGSMFWELIFETLFWVERFFETGIFGMFQTSSRFALPIDRIRSRCVSKVCGVVCPPFLPPFLRGVKLAESFFNPLFRVLSFLWRLTSFHLFLRLFKNQDIFWIWGCTAGLSYSVVRYFLHLLELSLPGVPIYLPFLAKYMKEVQERFTSSTLFFGLYTPQIVFASSSNLFLKELGCFV